MQNLLKSKPSEPKKEIAFLSYGFRPFFLLSAIFAVAHIITWMLVFNGKLAPFHIGNIPHLYYWHAHEMIFGYSLAVIAGFLLTAVINWTNHQTLSGYKLIPCFLAWLLARIILVNSSTSLIFAMFFDCLFFVITIIAILIPIYKSNNRRQLAIIIKLVLILACNIAFYLSALKVLSPDAMRPSLYFGFYLVISIILTLCRRVLPFFISNTLLDKSAIKNNTYIDRALIFLFLAFAIVDSFFTQSTVIVAILSVTLFVLHSIRAYFWHHKSIWKNPLLWSFWSAYCIFTVGFFIKFLSITLGFLPSLATHVFAFGGIGLVTLSMMSRVSLGHTGRNVNQASRLVNISFFFIIVGLIFRVFLAILLPTYYSMLVDISALCWVIAFALFLVTYTKILLFK